MNWRTSLTSLGLMLGVRAARNVKRALLAWGLVSVTVIATRARAGRVRVPDSLVSACLRVTEGPDRRTAATNERSVRIDVESEPRAVVDPRFLSVAIDSSQLVGGHWWSPEAGVEAIGERVVAPIDLGPSRLRQLARDLAPAYLRIGGTEADRIYYGVGEGDPASAPAPFELVLTRREWDGVADFARDAGFDLFFTLNAGPSTRDGRGRWTTDNAERLLHYASARGDAIGVLELGNEINGYWFGYGISQQIDGATVAADLGELRRLAGRLMPDALIAGPAEFYWPRVGSPFASRTNVLGGLLAAGGGRALDVLTWHYYPEQSRRCPIATRRASPTELLDPASLDEVSRWAADVEGRRDKIAPSLPVWLGETGGAQCGGEPGASDRFASSLWWTDQLGLLASRGQSVVVRQTLVGSNYGLLDERTLEPRPDYFASVLFKRLMGRAVLGVDRRPGGDPFVRVYAHCTRDRGTNAAGSVTVLAINLHQDGDATLEWPRVSGHAVEIYQVTAPSLDSPYASLNGGRMVVSDGATTLEPRPAQLGDK